MDGGSDLNLIYQDIVRKMGINPTQINHINTTAAVHEDLGEMLSVNNWV